jgi:hypothetical protein
MAGIVRGVRDTSHDLYYEPGPWEQMPDGTRQRTCLTEWSATPGAPSHGLRPRYVFDTATRSYVWRGTSPSRETHRGVGVERFQNALGKTTIG